MVLCLRDVHGILQGRYYYHRFTDTEAQEGYKMLATSENTFFPLRQEYFIFPSVSLQRACGMKEGKEPAFPGFHMPLRARK